MTYAIIKKFKTLKNMFQLYLLLIKYIQLNMLLSIFFPQNLYNVS